MCRAARNDRRRDAILVLLALFAGAAAGCEQSADRGSAESPPGQKNAGSSHAAAAWANSGEHSDADQVRAADISVLFVGNSHTAMHDLPNLVCELIRFGNPKLTVYSHYVPVGFLEDVARTPTCREEIETRPWTFVVLQAQKISMSGRYEYSRKEAIDVAKLACRRGATVVFYPEWGRKGVRGDGERQEQVYRELAEAANVGLAPVARAWDLALAVQPDLALHAADGNHQSALGAFLTACVLAGTLTGDAASNFAPYPYPATDQKLRDLLTDAAGRAIRAEKLASETP
ncbi:MAG: hypothetical protein U1D55_19680 [Phycisphaerae bacterium]